MDIFGLAALQPPREIPLRPKIVKRQTVAVVPDCALAFSKIEAGVTVTGAPIQGARKASSSKSVKRESKHRETQNEHSALAKIANIARGERDAVISQPAVRSNPLSIRCVLSTWSAAIQVLNGPGYSLVG